MRPFLRALVLFAILIPTSAWLTGCKREAASDSAAPPPPPAAMPGAAKQAALDVDAARPKSARQVIQKADLQLQVSSPADAQAKVTALVEREGGYVESASREAPQSESAAQSVRLTLRVPAERLNAILERIRRLGNGRHAETITSEDVTEESIDLDARIRMQSELEQRLLALLANATNVEGALGVHKELTVVRTEIERLKGRQRFLEREVAYSSVTLLLTAPAVDRVSFGEIGKSFSSAYSDALLVGSGLIVAIVRLAGIVLPVLVLFGVAALLAYLVLRRLGASRRARALAAASPAPSVVASDS